MPFRVPEAELPFDQPAPHELRGCDTKLKGSLGLQLRGEQRGGEEAFFRRSGVRVICEVMTFSPAAEKRPKREGIDEDDDDDEEEFLPFAKLAPAEVEKLTDDGGGNCRCILPFE